MTSIRREIVVQARPEDVWDAVRDIGDVHRRLVPGVLTDAYLDGDARVVTFANGLVARELIVSLDDQTRRFAYAVVAGLPGARHHHASFEVVAEGRDGSRLIWITDLLPDELAPKVAELMELGAGVMQQTLEHPLARDR